MSAAEIGIIIGAIAGLLAVTPPILKEIRGVLSGRAAAEKARNRSALTVVDDLEIERTWRRSLQEHITVITRLLLDMGYPERTLPTEPTRPQKVTQ